MRIRAGLGQKTDSGRSLTERSCKGTSGSLPPRPGWHPAKEGEYSASGAPTGRKLTGRERRRGSSDTNRGKGTSFHRRARVVSDVAGQRPADHNQRMAARAKIERTIRLVRPPGADG